MQNRTLRVRGLVFGGLMAALLVVCALIPVLGAFIPIPLILAYVRYGARVSVMSAIVAVLFSAMFVGPVQAFLILVPMGVLPGLAFGYGFRNKKKPLITGLLVVLLFFIGTAADYVVTREAVLGGRDPIADTLNSKEMRDMLNPIFNAVEQSYKNYPAKNDTDKQNVQKAVDQLEQIRKDPVSYYWYLMPSMVFLMGVGFTWINYWLCRLILPRFGHEIPTPTPFGEFWLPAWVTWSFALLLLGVSYFRVDISKLSGPWWVQGLTNLLYPLQFVFVFVGMAVAYGFLRKKNVAKPLAVLLMFAGLFLLGGGLGMLLYMMLAMWDTVFDFRGLGHGALKRPKENE